MKKGVDKIKDDDHEKNSKITRKSSSSIAPSKIEFRRERNIGHQKVSKAHILGQMNRSLPTLVKPRKIQQVKYAAKTENFEKHSQSVFRYDRYLNIWMTAMVQQLYSCMQELRGREARGARGRGAHNPRHLPAEIARIPGRTGQKNARFTPMLLIFYGSPLIHFITSHPQSSCSVSISIVTSSDRARALNSAPVRPLTIHATISHRSSAAPSTASSPSPPRAKVRSLPVEQSVG